eukprot:gnl/Carplike_NY0171/1164_a1578_895.p1 GENE.gnl/Carplike_NY0171/1164_a1578_895~~gnl/Carplike_NY0171/1164_a1578_895.p1  ORF type:complete len:892 (+),score=322.55 gnl/Carplike_NY0171/1164_a1578_895:139-2676(+)
MADIVSYVKFSLGRTQKDCAVFGIFQATATSIRNRMLDRWNKTQKKYEETRAKTVCYLSLEFLMGRALTNSLYSIGLTGPYGAALKELSFSLEEIQAEESDMALGNGGLGRLAACFIDSLATLSLPAVGYGLRYNFGMFEQTIMEGFQVEKPENWLRRGNPWEIERFKLTYPIRFYGHTSHKTDPTTGRPVFDWEGGEVVNAVAYDTLIPGSCTANVNHLRLWSARASSELSLDAHASGDYLAAVKSKALSENITYVLYPGDQSEEGKRLRLKQEYFFVSASLQDILSKAWSQGIEAKDLPKHFAIQLNDTHPAMAIPELMRLLIDGADIETIGYRGLEWTEAFEIVRKMCFYTNHTVLPEALEEWPVYMFKMMLPRHLQIIYEINHRFLEEVEKKFPGDVDRIRRMSLISEGDQQRIRMANLAIVGSNKVNGVARIHTDILKASLFRDFEEFYGTEKIVNFTNGVTPRRWIAQANPALSEFIYRHLEQLGVVCSQEEWPVQLHHLAKLAELSQSRAALEQLLEVKYVAKTRLAEFIKETCDVDVSPDMLFDTQVKRIHEYKRQLLNILHVIVRFLSIKRIVVEATAEYSKKMDVESARQAAIKELKDANVVPRMCLFAGKAAIGYDRAKRIIKLITSVGELVNHDRDVSDFLKIVFIPNYNVSSAELIFPGSDISEQISTAGMEAAGTGNMKASMNGGLLVATRDGASIEIGDHVGEDNVFFFGASKTEIIEVRKGYQSGTLTEELDPRLIDALDAIDSGMFGCQEYFKPITDTIRSGKDWFCVAHDFAAYLDIQDEVDALYIDRIEWARKMLMNVSKSYHFSSDRTIKEYAEMWDLVPVKLAP